ncbi:hypothetical protein SD074_23770 [Prolixibacter sp. SD074]|nr:hypothetical protein SD074_23770 [Prolixibacter sp. SD074]
MSYLKVDYSTSKFENNFPMLFVTDEKLYSGTNIWKIIGFLYYFASVDLKKNQRLNLFISINVKI